LQQCLQSQGDKQNKEMKAIRIAEPLRVEVVDIDRPVCGDEEVLLKIRFVGFCGSDLNTYRGGNPMVKMPVIPGHEIGAEIEEIGSKVPAGFEKGQIVTVTPYTNCENCSSCRNHRVNACEHNETLGVQRNGAMCEYIALPWQKIVATSNMTVEHCALIEPMSVGFHAVNRAQVTDNDFVMVIGCGMIGVGAIVRAALRGATVIACDLDDEKLEGAKNVGATYVINSAKEDVHARLQKITGGYMPDVVVEAVGSPATYQMAVSEVGFTGRVVCIGYAKKDVTFQTKLFVQKELDIRGSRNALPEDFRAVARYLVKGTCPYDKLITKVIRPEEAADTLKWWSENPQKVFRILVKF
jgi:threonine dehydrogenase-like Zn-dependent dehydrogenase